MSNGQDHNAGQAHWVSLGYPSAVERYRRWNRGLNGVGVPDGPLLPKQGRTLFLRPPTFCRRWSIHCFLGRRSDTSRCRGRLMPIADCRRGQRVRKEGGRTNECGRIGSRAHHACLDGVNPEPESSYKRHTRIADLHGQHEPVLIYLLRISRLGGFVLVGGTGFEPVTPAV